MTRNWLLILAASVVVSSCSAGEEPRQNVDGSAPQNEFGFNEALNPPSILPRFGARGPSQSAQTRKATVDIDMPVGTTSQAAKGSDIPVSLPKIAYIYNYGYQMPANAIPVLQRKHADYCETVGPQVCRIMNLQQNALRSERAQGQLHLAVESSQARRFGEQLAKIAGESDGIEVSSSIRGEDLTKKIVDTEARLRARTLLRDRLMGVLASNKGTVKELLEAERGVADVNEEIDKARSWLNDMRGRVEFAQMQISYKTKAGAFQPQKRTNGFIAPVSEALGNVGAIVGYIIALFITLLTVVLPVGLIVWGAVKILRKLRGSSLRDATMNNGGELPEETYESSESESNDRDNPVG